jgi:MFS family permease
VVVSNCPKDSGGIVRPGKASLGVVLALTWLGSFGTGIGWSGVFFVAKEAFGFGERMNLLLAAAVGAGYTISAFFAGFTVGVLTAKLFRGMVRHTLLAVIAGLAVCCFLLASFPSPWVLVGLCAVYNGLCGLLWPTVEAYLSGGRTPAQLRNTTGRFNIAWATAVVVSMVAMTALTTTPDEARWVFAGLGVLHLVMLPIAMRLPTGPAGRTTEMLHDDPEESNPVPLDRAALLLKVFRVELTLSYVLIAGVGPILPHVLEEVGIPEKWRAAVGATWMLSRVGAFVLFERWHGWHGRFRTVIWSSVLLVVGVAGTAASINAWSVISSLAVLGIGMGAAYAGAIYYAMHAGGDHVDEGGRHEAVIGLGYTIGPMLVLIVGMAIGGLS